MKGRLLVALSAIGASIALFAFAGTGLADPSELFVQDVPPHRHFIATPSEKLVAVGPQVCENSALMPAFEQFHHNIHHSLVPNPTPGLPPITVHTLGPQDGAPGLNPSKTKGAEITARPCSFVNP